MKKQPFDSFPRRKFMATAATGLSLAGSGALLGGAKKQPDSETLVQALHKSLSEKQGAQRSFRSRVWRSFRWRLSPKKRERVPSTRLLAQLPLEVERQRLSKSTP